MGVPRSRLPAFTRDVAALLARDHPNVTLTDYGHWGDGGTHLNLVWPKGAVADRQALVTTLQDAIYPLAVERHGGSYSAEHGVGPHNQRFYDRFADPAVKRLCRALAECCDPGRLLGTVRLD